jgi:sialic acid synthase SpsE
MYLSKRYIAKADGSKSEVAVRAWSPYAAELLESSDVVWLRVARDENGDAKIYNYVDKETGEILMSTYVCYGADVPDISSNIPKTIVDSLGIDEFPVKLYVRPKVAAVTL